MPPVNSSAQRDTIYALSSGAPPAAIAIIRISGPQASHILEAMAGTLPVPRMATLRRLCDAAGDILDRALVLWFPGPASATGEDLVELHLHGGRAVVAGVFQALKTTGLRLAEPGEFTRRALVNGRIDYNEAEGLADLLAAETEAQRRDALRRTEGELSRRLQKWTADLLSIAARTEAAIDYDGEDEVAATATEGLKQDIADLCREIDRALNSPVAEQLRSGLRVVIAGAPNAGKSTLFNHLAGRDRAIVSNVPGTTRDTLEIPISLGGLPFLLIDTAGIRETHDPVEKIGIERAERERATADIVIALDEYGDRQSNVINVSAKADVQPIRPKAIPISVVSGQGLELLYEAIIDVGSSTMGSLEGVSLDERHRAALMNVRKLLGSAYLEDDALLLAEQIRVARIGIDQLTGQAGVEDLLDILFGRFCLGK